MVSPPRPVSVPPPSPATGSSAPTARGLGPLGPAPILKLPAAPIDPADLPVFDLPDATNLHLPGPPKPGSLAAKADLAAVKAIVKRRTPEGDRWAADLSRRGGLSMWRDAATRLGKETGGIKGIGQRALVLATMGATAVVTRREKQHFDRQRPFEVDPSITVVGKVPPGRSYPSGHTSSAFAAATILGHLDAGRAKEYLAGAAQVGASRVYAGVHFPTDVAAGAALGMAAGKIAAEAADRGGMSAWKAMRAILGLYNQTQRTDEPTPAQANAAAEATAQLAG